VAENSIRAFWNGDELTEDRGYLIVKGSEWIPRETTGPALRVSGGSDGFFAVLARPAASKRDMNLGLAESPEPGSYIFKPAQAGYDFEVRLEFGDEPFPEPRMLTLDLTSDLCDAAVGDRLTVALRKNATKSPDIKEISGPIIQMADSCGTVPDYTQMSAPYTEFPVASLLVDISDEQQSVSESRSISPSPSHKPSAPSDNRGRVDVIGRSEPFELRWEGDSNEPALDIEYVTVDPTDCEPWIVQNDTLPDVEFTPLRELSMSERTQELTTAFERASNAVVPGERVLEGFAAAVDAEVPQIEITVRYASSKSDEIQSKSGTLSSVQSMYYSEPNRARHQVRFKDSKLYYLLADPHEDAETPIGVYSKSYARHWDTELGEVRSVNVSEE